MGFALGLAGGVYGVRFIADRMTRTSTGEAALPPMLLEIDWLPVAVTAVFVTDNDTCSDGWGQIQA